MALQCPAPILLLYLFVASVDAAYGPGCGECSAGMPYPCSHVNSKALAEAAFEYLSSTDDEESAAWGKVTSDDLFKKAKGFYVFAYDYAGPCVAHGARADFVGKTLPQIVAMVNNPTDGQTVDDALQAGAEGGGGWTLYDWTNSGDDAPYKKIAYTKKLGKWGNNYYLGVGFNQLPGALDADCSPSGASACAEHNSLHILGDLMASLYTASADEMNAIFRSIDAKETYNIGGFYPFIYEFAGPCVAHGGRSEFVGKTLPEIVAYINNPSNGQEIDDALQAGAEGGGKWVEYMWKNNAEEDAYRKISYTMKFTNGGADYYVGVGYNNVCGADYAAMPSCSSSPAVPVTGAAGKGVCIPKASMTGMECGDVKKHYKNNGCCGNPSKTFQ